jgi:hypothetical protein
MEEKRTQVNKNKNLKNQQFFFLSNLFVFKNGLCFKILISAYPEKLFWCQLDKLDCLSLSDTSARLLEFLLVRVKIGPF